MPAQQVNLQPKSHSAAVPGLVRNTPPKPQDRAAQQAALRAAADFQAAGINSPDPNPQANLTQDGSFKDVDQIFGSGADAPVPASEPSPIQKKKGGRPKKNQPAVESKAEPAKVPNKQTVKTVEMPTQQLMDVQSPAPKVRPPSTQREYQNSRRNYDSDAYPDIDQIFTGKIPDIKPENGIVDPRVIAAQAPPVVQIQTVEIEHVLPDKAHAYRITRDCLAYMDGYCFNFNRNEIIYDTRLIDQLLITNFRYMEPVEIADSFITCPNCRHQFPPVAAAK